MAIMRDKKDKMGYFRFNPYLKYYMDKKFVKYKLSEISGENITTDGEVHNTC